MCECVIAIIIKRNEDKFAYSFPKFSELPIARCDKSENWRVTQFKKRAKFRLFGEQLIARAPFLHFSQFASIHGIMSLFKIIYVIMLIK